VIFLYISLCASSTTAKMAGAMEPSNGAQVAPMTLFCRREDFWVSMMKNNNHGSKPDSILHKNGMSMNSLNRLLQQNIRQAYSDSTNINVKEVILRIITQRLQNEANITYKI